MGPNFRRHRIKLYLGAGLPILFEIEDPATPARTLAVVVVVLVVIVVVVVIVVDLKVSKATPFPGIGDGSSLIRELKKNELFQRRSML